MWWRLLVDNNHAAMAAALVMAAAVVAAKATPEGDGYNEVNGFVDDGGNGGGKGNCSGDGCSTQPCVCVDTGQGREEALSLTPLQTQQLMQAYRTLTRK